MAFTLSQSNQATATIGASSVSVTLPGVSSSGQLLIAVTAEKAAAEPLDLTLSDSNGYTWTLVGGVDIDGDSYPSFAISPAAIMWYRLVQANDLTSAVTVTATVPGGDFPTGSTSDLWVGEFHGFSATPSLDTKAVGSQSSTSTTSLTIPLSGFSGTADLSVTITATNGSPGTMTGTFGSSSDTGLTVISPSGDSAAKVLWGAVAQDATANQVAMSYTTSRSIASVTAAFYDHVTTVTATPTTAAVTASAPTPTATVTATATGAAVTANAHGQENSGMTAQVSATPAAVAVTATGYNGITALAVVPSTAAVGASAYGPSITGGTVTVTPTTASVAVSARGPAIALTANTTTAAVTASAYSPGIGATVTGATATVTATAGTVAATVTPTPGTATVAVSAYGASGNVSANPTTASVAIVVSVPPVFTGHLTIATPTTASVAATAFGATKYAPTPPSVIFIADGDATAVTPALGMTMGAVQTIGIDVSACLDVNQALANLTVELIGGGAVSEIDSTPYVVGSTIVVTIDPTGDGLTAGVPYTLRCTFGASPSTNVFVRDLPVSASL